ncbi:MAG: hypothetical protein A2Y97_14035, partial [Nitrospirae bacterium RBG_13_39_12]
MARPEKLKSRLSSQARFLFNNELWDEITVRVNKAKRVNAAVAYLSKTGSELLPLKKGDRLVLDMSIAAVRQGVTDPREVQKFIDRGVHVFSRNSLHAKFLIIDNVLITSSANISMNSRGVLDEAGILTTDPVAIRRALSFFDKLCSEPVRAQYLKECLKAYQPPKFKAATTIPHRKPGQRGKRIVQAKLWFIGGLRLVEVSNKDASTIARIEDKAERQLANPEKTSVSWVRYSRHPKFLDQIRVGDWVIQCMSDGKSKYVEAPAQVLGQDLYISHTGKKYHMLMLESPDAGEAISLSEFRQKVKTLEPLLDNKSPRTKPIANQDHADAVL